MVRKSIRVVLVAENDVAEVGGDPDAEEPRRISYRRLGPCVKKTEPKCTLKKRNYIDTYFLKKKDYLWMCCFFAIPPS